MPRDDGSDAPQFSLQFDPHLIPIYAAAYRYRSDQKAREAAATIIDWRTLAALGREATVYSVRLYLDYLAYCRSLAAKQQVSLRDLDKAMWAWSEKHGSQA